MTRNEFFPTEPTPYNPIENTPGKSECGGIPLEFVEELVRREKPHARTNTVCLGKRLHEAIFHRHRRHEHTIFGKNRRTPAFRFESPRVPLEVGTKNLTQHFEGVGIIGMNHVVASSPKWDRKRP